VIILDCVKTKDPNSILDYGFNWTKWLDRDTLNSSTWIVPTGITEVSNNYSGQITAIWLSGGTLGEVYKIVNRITTVGGRTDDRTLVLKIRNK